MLVRSPQSTKLFKGRESLLTSEKGVALITALLFTVIGLAMILTTIYMTTRGTRISGTFKSYKTALDASYAAADLIALNFIPNKITGTTLATLGNYGGRAAYGINDACFASKLTSLTAAWGCGSSTLDPTDTPDITLTLQATGGSPFDVFAKIVDTTSGNSDTSGLELDALGVVDSNTTNITPQHSPFLYRIEIQGQRQSNPNERINLSILYAY